MTFFEWEKFRRVVYGEGATFVPVCVKCRRFVKAPATLLMNDVGWKYDVFPQCSKCGPTEMFFEGYI